MTAAKPANRPAKKAAKAIKAAKKDGAPAGKPTLDSEVEVTNARNRALWKSQQREATSVESAKHGTLVDERARVRSLTGMSWSNRKPR